MITASNGAHTRPLCTWTSTAARCAPHRPRCCLRCCPPAPEWPYTACECRLQLPHTHTNAPYTDMVAAANGTHTRPLCTWTSTAVHCAPHRPRCRLRCCQPAPECPAAIAVTTHTPTHHHAQALSLLQTAPAHDHNALGQARRRVLLPIILAAASDAALAIPSGLLLI